MKSPWLAWSIAAVVLAVLTLVAWQGFDATNVVVGYGLPIVTVAVALVAGVLIVDRWNQ